MEDIIVYSLGENEHRRFFRFARSLPDFDSWGKKCRYLRGDFKKLKEFFAYIKPFQPKCFLVAEEDKRFVGFVVAVYNPDWIGELQERYGRNVEKRAYVLGIAVVDRRKDVLKALTDEMVSYFSQTNVEGVEYPTLGNICLTTATDVLTSENPDPLIMFREVGFRISECYYSMKLDLDTFTHEKRRLSKWNRFRVQERSIEIVEGDEVLGRIMWDPTENEKASIDISVAPSYRGRGLGTALMAEALQRLKTCGVKIVELGVDGNNLSALRLYRKFGFTVCKTHFYIYMSFR